MATILRGTWLNSLFYFSLLKRRGGLIGDMTALFYYDEPIFREIYILFLKGEPMGVFLTMEDALRQSSKYDTDQTKIVSSTYSTRRGGKLPRIIEILHGKEPVTINDGTGLEDLRHYPLAALADIEFDEIGRPWYRTILSKENMMYKEKDEFAPVFNEENGKLDIDMSFIKDLIDGKI